jgi:hypothetical protein
MDAEQSKPTTIASTSLRSSSFSVEALISKPGQKTRSNIINDTNLGSQSNFSVERILNKQCSREEELENKIEVSTLEKRNSRDTEDNSSDFPWMHSTRYDPPPSKFILPIYHPSSKYVRKHLKYNCFNCPQLFNPG